ncbi:GtrA family protein [Porticoccus sp.]
MIRYFESRQFLSFLVAGGIAALVNFGSRMLLSVWLNFSVAIVFAYVIGMTTAFLLSKRYVFRDGKLSVGSSAMYFFLVNVVAVAQTWLVSVSLAYYIFPKVGIQSHVEEMAHAAGIVMPVFTSYLGHKYISFR